MSRLLASLALLLVASAAAAAAAASAPPAMPGADASRMAAVEAAVREQLSRLTLEQKARQLDMYHGEEFLSNGRLNRTKARAVLEHGVGLIHDLYPVEGGAALMNELQEMALAGVAGVPALYVEECLHGLEQRDHSIFPNPLAMGATWSPETVHDVAQAIRAEARSFGVRMCLAPVLGAGRDPRWGRQEELFSEDPHLISQMALAYVQALQTPRGELGNDSVVAEPKHFAAHSVPQGGRNAGPTHVGRRELESVFLPPFRAAVQGAGALAVMAAYSELDGVPCPANPFLLNETLRGQFGFRGFVLSDLGAVAELQGTHRVVATASEAVVEYLASGGNAQFYDFPHEVFQAAVVDAVRNGTLPAALVDSRVADVLRVKELLRLRDQPLTDPGMAARVVASPAHQRVALDAARRAVVLLENRNSTLPLRPGAVPALALLGSSAFQPRWGDYSGGGGNLNNRLSVPLAQGLADEFAAQRAAGLDAPALFLREWGTGVADDYELNPVHRGQLAPPRGAGFPAGAQGLLGEYWNNDALRGEPALRRRDEEVNFQWYHYDYNGSYSREAPFSARWTGTLVPTATVPAAEFAVEFAADAGTAGARLYLNGTLALDLWDCTAPGVRCPLVAVRDLAEGVPVPVRLEYRRGTGDASVSLRWGLAGPAGLARAVRAAERARDAGGVAVVCVGDSTQSSGEDHDRARLTLPGRQLELVERVVRTNVTTVVVLLSGRAAAVPWIATHAGAVLEGFGLGQAQGTALADVLYGRYNPAGRLPVTFPVEVGQVPLFYNHMPSARKDYQYVAARPQYAFGHGLSYTTFRYLDMRASDAVVARSPSAFTVTVLVENNGTRDGEEVVQLYMRDDVSSVTTPVRQLRGFSRVAVPAGGRVEVHFSLRVPDDLALFNREQEWAAESGTFTFWAGGSSDRTPLNCTVRLELPEPATAAPQPTPAPPAGDGGWDTTAALLLAATVLVAAAMLLVAVRGCRGASSSAAASASSASSGAAPRELPHAAAGEPLLDPELDYDEKEA